MSDCDGTLGVHDARVAYEEAQARAAWERMSEMERVLMLREEDPDGTSWLLPYPEPGWGEEMHAAIRLKRIEMIDTCTHAYWRTARGRKVAAYGRTQTGGAK